MFWLCLRVLLLLSTVLIAAESAKADFLLRLNLNPNVYTVAAGGQVTLRGSFTTADALTFIYFEENLFGFTPAGPHLGIVSGSVLSSQDFDPPEGGVYFNDRFGGGGYLGPDPVNGPIVTAVGDLRTFVIPATTAAGIYRYSYGVSLLPTAGESGTVLFDQSLTIVVTAIPEPSNVFLLVTAFGAWAVLRCWQAIRSAPHG